jgi:hypothetical protein
MRGSDLGARIRFGVQVEIYLDRFDRLRRSEFANFRRRWRQILIWQVWSQGTRCCRVWWWNELSAMLSPLFNTPPCFVSWCFYGGNLLHKALSRSGGVYGIDDAPSRENSYETRRYKKCLDETNGFGILGNETYPGHRLKLLRLKCCHNSRL